MERLGYKIKKVGTLGYPRLESLSILRKELNSFGYRMGMSEVKAMLDSILDGTFDGIFNLTFNFCFDKIFDGMEYEEQDGYEIEGNNFVVETPSSNSILVSELEEFFFQMGEDWHLWEDGPYPIQRTFDAMKKFIEFHKTKNI